MMNSYHYCYYYYCYDYDDYPSCCCRSVLLNDFLSLDEHDLLHLEASLIFSVPQKDTSMKKNKSETLTVRYLHPVSDIQTLLGHYCHLGLFDHGSHKRGSITWTWCSRRLTLPAMVTSSVPQPCMDYAHYQNAPCLFSAFSTSISDCLLSQQVLVSWYPLRCGWWIF